MAEEVRFLIVDDHEITRVGFMALALLEPTWTVCGESGDAGKALELALRLRPDFAVVDLRLAGGEGLELIKNLRHELSGIRILVYSGSDDSLFAERSILAGAQGFLMKLEPVATLQAAIRRILDGGIFLSEKMTSQTLTSVAKGRRPSPTPFETLSDRELEIYQLIGAGQSIKEIARDLHLSPKTVEYHRENIKEKLNLPHASALLRHATAWTLECG